MSQATALKSLTTNRAPARRIVHRTRGRSHGPITRLISPSNLGELLKPFVFLDIFDFKNAPFTGMNLHPHSGIATVTHLFEGSIKYEDTTGATGTLSAGGVEWFKAGGGAWHGGGPGDDPQTRGFQLWVALPPEHELGPVESVYMPSEAVERDGPARVLIGSFGNAKSSLVAPVSMNYLAVRLKAGESWRYEPPMDHGVAWTAVGKGHLSVPETVRAGELVAFEASNEAIEFRAEADAEFVLGSAAHHPHDLLLGHYSVHTSPSSLQRGEQQITEIGARLRQDGRL